MGILSVIGYIIKIPIYIIYNIVKKIYIITYNKYKSIYRDTLQVNKIQKYNKKARSVRIDEIL